MTDYPHNAKNLPIGQKRKRGRPLGSQLLEKLFKRKELNESATDTTSSIMSPPFKKNQKRSD